LKDAAKLMVPLAERGLRQARKAVEAAPAVDAASDAAPWVRQHLGSALGDDKANAGAAVTAAEATDALEAVLASHPLAAVHWWGYKFKEPLVLEDRAAQKQAAALSPSPSDSVFFADAAESAAGLNAEEGQEGVEVEEAAYAAAQAGAPPFPEWAQWVGSEGLAHGGGDSKRLYEAASDAHARDPFPSVPLAEARAFRDAAAVLAFLRRGGDLSGLPLSDQAFLLAKPLRYVTAWSAKVVNEPLASLVGALVVQAGAHRRPPRALFVLKAFKSFAVPSVAAVEPLPHLDALHAEPSGMDVAVRTVASADPSIPGGFSLPVDKAMACGLGLVLPRGLQLTAAKHAEAVQRLQQQRERVESAVRVVAVAQAAVEGRAARQRHAAAARAAAAAEATRQQAVAEAAALAREAAEAETADKAFDPDR
jgi:hypothetical protein